MNRLIAIITGLHVLTHSVFGCCSHDILPVAPHSCCCHSTSKEVCTEHLWTQVQFEEPNSHAFGCRSCRSNAPSVPHHDCQHSSCQWLVSKSLSAADLLHFDLNSTFATAPCLLGIKAWEADIVALHAQSDIAKSVSLLRLHLSLCVMQI